MISIEPEQKKSKESEESNEINTFLLGESDKTKYNSFIYLGTLASIGVVFIGLIINLVTPLETTPLGECYQKHGNNPVVFAQCAKEASR